MVNVTYSWVEGAAKSCVVSVTPLCVVWSNIKGSIVSTELPAELGGGYQRG